MDTLEQRIERLERSQRRYRVATMAVVLLAVASGFAKDSVPKVLRTQKLEIVTAKGVTVATLDKGLGGSLTLYDDEGKQRASLWAHSFGSMLSMQGDSDSTLVDIGGLFESAHVKLRASKGTNAIHMIASGNARRPVLTLTDQNNTDKNLGD